MARFKIGDIQGMAERGELICCVTAYDYPTAYLADRIGIPMLLVGDSLGNVILGYDSTIPVTMEEMLHHTKPVVRGTQKAMVVADMPFMSYQANADQAVFNSGRMLQEGGAQAVKLEGGQRSAATIQRIVEAGIPVMGHLGLTPQSINQMSGYKVQGKTLSAAEELISDAITLQQAGVFALVIESVPAPLTKIITEQVSIPTIGIGAGPHCDGQILVLHDLLGLSIGSIPRHAKQYTNLATQIEDALRSYLKDVQSGVFPAEEHGHPLNKEVLEWLEARGLTKQ